MKPLSRRTIPKSLILIAIVFLSLPALSAAKDLYTITLKDGTTYELALCHVNEANKTIFLEHSEIKDTVSFREVRSIVDVNGCNVTYSILGDDTERALLEASSQPLPEIRRPKDAPTMNWTLGINVDVTRCMPSNSYYYGTKPGTGFGAEFVLAVSRNTALKAAIHKSGVAPERDNSITFHNYWSQLWTLHNLDISAVRYFITVERYFETSIIRLKPTLFTLEWGLGLLNHKLGGDLSEYVRNDQEQMVFVSTTQISDSETRYTTTIGAGVIQKLLPEYGFYVKLNLDIVHFKGSYFEEGDPDVEASFASIVVLKFGVAFFF